MIRNTAMLGFCMVACAAAMAFPPVRVSDLKLSPEEATRINVYYQKFSFLDLSRQRLVDEVKAASIGRYANICGDDTSKWQAYMGELFSTTKYDPAVSAAIDQANAQESLVALATMQFRETIKSEETRRDLDQLEANNTTKNMFFTYLALAWFRQIGDEPTQIAEKFLQTLCGVKKGTPKKK